MLTIFLLIILGVDWASGFAIAGYVMRHGVTPVGYAFWQCFGPFLGLFFIQLIRRDIKFYSGSVKYAIGCGVFGVAIPNLLVYYASKAVDSGILTVLANIDPIFTYILALVFRVEKFNSKRMLMVLLGVIGVMVLVWPRSLNGVSLNLWLLLSLFIPLCYAFGVVFISKFKPAEGNTLNYSMWMLFFACIVIIPVTAVNRGYYWLSIDLNSGLIILEIILSTIGYILLFTIIRSSGPVMFTMVNGISVVSGLLYGKVVFNQYISGFAYGASLLILFAIVGMSILYIKDRAWNN